MPAALAALRGVCMTLPMRCARALAPCSHAVIKDRLSHGTELRRPFDFSMVASTSTAPWEQRATERACDGRALGDCGRRVAPHRRAEAAALHGAQRALYLLDRGAQGLLRGRG